MNRCHGDHENLDKEEFFKLLNDGAEQIGISLNQEQLLLFYKYLQELIMWNKKINLVKRKNEKEIIIKDFIDSLTAHKRIWSGASLLDLGSGAGFPGVPLKIIKPDLKVILYERSLKKIHFLQNLNRLLKIKGLNVKWAVDNKEIQENLLNSFDFVISRAFGSLSKFCQYGLPFLKKGGILLAMKGSKGEEELKASLPDLAKLGVNLSFIDHYRLPFLGHKRINIGLSLA